MAKKVVKKVKNEAEQGARRAVLEDLFYDFNSSKSQIFLINFVRGLFFGAGTLIGGTLIVALILGLLSQLVDLPGGVGDAIQYIVDIVRQKQS